MTPIRAALLAAVYVLAVTGLVILIDAMLAP